MIRDAARHGDAVLVFEPRPLDRDRRDRQVRGRLVTDRDRRQHRAVRQPHVVSAWRLFPPAALEVADQTRLRGVAAATRRGDCRAASARARTAWRPARRPLSRAPRAAVRGRPSSGPRGRRPSKRARAMRGHRPTARRWRWRAAACALRPPIAIPHAVELIEQRRPARARRPASRPPASASGRTAARTPATISASAARRISSSASARMRRRRTDWYGIRRRNISDGNSHDALLLALNQVHQHRNRERAQGRRRPGVRQIPSAHLHSVVHAWTDS